MKIAYYITGHGYGHAVRSIPVIEKLLSKRPSLQVVICTSAPQWLFSQLPPERILYRHVALEIGVLQADSFSVDIPATLKANQELLSRRTAVQEQERAFLVSSGITAVISDITPIVFPAARQAGIPAFAVANFSWDWIYSAWLERYPEFAPIIQWIRDAYAQADRLYRLPFFGDLESFARIEDVGLVCRKSREDRQRVRRLLGLENERILLVALRAADLFKVEWAGLPPDIPHLVATTPIPHPRARLLAEGQIPFEAVLAAADVVIAKPGYGIVSDVLANRTPIVYIPRRDFSEDPILCRALDEQAVSARMSHKEFREGQWRRALKKLEERDQRWTPVDLTGADQIADAVMEHLDQGRMPLAAIP